MVCDLIAPCDLSKQDAENKKDSRDDARPAIMCERAWKSGLESA